MKHLTKLSLTIRKKIAYINEVAPKVNGLNNDLIYTYDGGTFPFCIDVESIDITGNFVYIWVNSNDTYIDRTNITYQRFKIDTSNNVFANEDLKHTLNVIAKEYKKALKNL